MSSLHHHDQQQYEPITPNNKRGLSVALSATAIIMFLEFFGGLITNSLALLSDSGHMLSDVSSLALSLVAITFAARPPSSNKTFGYQRFEILAALFNALTLLAIAAFITVEAYQRFQQPQAVDSVSMIVIAFIGMAANVISAVALLKQGDVKDNINIRSAYLHVIGDTLSSVGAIVAGILMQLYSWYWVDPLVSVVVAVVISKGAWKVAMQALHILMEGVPPDIDTSQVHTCLASITGVSNVHELRVWSLTSGCNVLSCHLVIENTDNRQSILTQATNDIREKFKIQQVAIQIETPDYQCMQKTI
ncbi:Cadmium, cobalt and zinc/H(+)-K(+) antiporter [Sporomusa silvacetica DSM 10669]|uniref:Cadmium, cobalt and zinc/H(+)-K(+) antiporter n=1 Tax=Sporomusa silvacetica DSM 10669 TaxID=1123289 RepID=A0ABZ3IID6_9FIRM|nr:cation diffusion facilitator family transporter [Sporomusa silvacetica]OZC22116.1 cadmium, cobalt and zinc/H(+)-K(+) antiporter [Sporomusa silvacetica DSM 10669]